MSHDMVNEMQPAEQRAPLSPMPAGVSKSVHDAVIEDLLGLGLAYSEWRTKLESWGYMWNDKLKRMIIEKEWQFFKAEIQCLRSEPNISRSSRIISNSCASILKRLKGEIWAAGVKDEREERRRVRRLLGKDAKVRTLHTYAKRWDLEASSSVSRFPSRIAAGQSSAESTSSQRAMIGEQVPSLLIEAQTIKTSRPSDEEWESHKESIGRLYIDESSSTAVDIAMTWESVQEQHVQKEVIGYSNDWLESQNEFPSYMFDAPKATDDYNVLNDFLNSSLLDDGALIPDNAYNFYTDQSGAMLPGRLNSNVTLSRMQQSSFIMPGNPQGDSNSSPQHTHLSPYNYLPPAHLAPLQLAPNLSGFNYASAKSFELAVPLEHGHREQQIGVIPMADDVPFTDSGYKSAPHLEHSMNVEPVLEKSTCPLSRHSPPQRGDRSDYDTKTLYSIGSTVNPGHARNYVMELSKDIYSKLHRSIDAKDMTVLSKILPELVKAFAIKLCHDAPNPLNRKIMHFIHKRHQDVIAQLEIMFNHNEEDEPDRTQGHDGDMSILEKMSMWMSKAEQDHSAQPKGELFEGVKEDEEDLIDQDELSGYHNIIVESPAYEWFLKNIANEFILQLGTPQPRIRQRILDELPTGTISKRRSPDTHEVTIDLEWHHAMEERLRDELLVGPRRPSRFFRSSIVMTGSPGEAQGLTIKQYLARTWPTTGFQLLDALDKATTNFGRDSYVSLPGNTHLATRILPSHLIVTATGPAYFVAECGEVLAWMGSALLSNAQKISSYCLPRVTNFRVDPSHSNSTSLKSKAYCSFNFELTQLGLADESLPGIQNFSRDLLGQNTIILGFPISRRPEGLPGLELSFDILLLYLQAPKAEIFALDVFIRGPKRVLKLIKHIDGVFLWRLDHSLADYPSCYPAYYSKPRGNVDFSSLDHRALEAGRHILSKFADDFAPPEDPYRSSDESFVGIKPKQSRSLVKRNPADGPKFSSQNWTDGQNHGILSGVSESHTDGTTLSSSSIRSLHSIFENDLRTPHSENLERWEILSQGSNMCSTGSQPSPTMESLEDSLDSDMFSISEFSEDVELLDPREPVYPILNIILHELLAGFRTATQHQQFLIEGGGRSGNLASTTETSQSGDTSRSSQKRKLPQEEDDTGEDGSCPPPPKKMKSGQGKKPQKSFACPYLKWDPGKFKECCKLKLSRISDVKNHLHRKHTPHHYCPLCQAIFPDEDSLQGHIEDRNCSRRDPTMLIGVSRQQYQQLHKKSDSDASEEDKWYRIWDILFPQHAKPPSVYIDTNLAIEMRHFREYCDNRGPAIMRERLESNSEWLSSENTEEQRGVYLERVIAQGFNTLFEDWVSNGSSTASSPRRLGSNSTQQSQYETPTSSLVDSGVGMGGQASSRETNSQASEFPPTFRVPAFQPTAPDAHARHPWSVQDGAPAPPPIHIQSPPSASLGSGMGGQENPENQNHAFDHGILNDWDWDTIIAFEDMPAILPEPGRKY